METNKMKNILSKLDTLKQLEVTIDRTGDITPECSCIMRLILQKNLWLDNNICIFLHHPHHDKLKDHIAIEAK
jgi:hypothetical protein